MILTVQVHFGLEICFLHVCGGDPAVSKLEDVKTLFSPRMWR